MDTSNKGCFHAKTDSGPLIIMVMMCDSILMILIKTLIKVTLFPDNGIKSNVAHCSVQSLLRPRVTDNLDVFETTSTATQPS